MTEATPGTLPTEIIEWIAQQLWRATNNPWRVGTLPMQAETVQAAYRAVAWNAIQAANAIDRPETRPWERSA